jgi:hypothetical protein
MSDGATMSQPASDVRNLFLDGADRLADEILGVKRFGAGFVALVRFGVGKDRDARDGKLRRALGCAHGLVDRETLDVGHRGDRGTDVCSIDNKQRPDQIVGRQHMLAHHAPRPFGAAVAARTDRQIEAVLAGRLRFDRRRADPFERPTEFDCHQFTP